MAVIPDVDTWAEAHFGTTDLGHRRRTRRLVQAAAAIAARPEKPFTQVFDWNQLRGFYRLCDQDQATPAALQGPHWQQTRQAMGRLPLVLVVHDTTELDFSSHKALRGAGPIGEGHGTGFLQHNSLAVLPDPRSVLGLAYQQLVVRQPAPEGETPYRRKRRDRESDLWRHGIAASGRPPAGCCWVDICDRAADDYEVVRTARDAGHDLLIRVSQNRLVYRGADGASSVHALDYARTLPSQGTDRVEVVGKGGRPGRTAVVHLAGAPVWMPAPAGTPRRATQPAYPLWVIRVWEADPPSGAAEPLEWLLYCSLPSGTLAELKQRRDWYCCRSLIEVFHDIEKNGCSEEDRRFETAERMAACLAVLSVVAVRVFQLRCALAGQPEGSAEQVGTAQEVGLVAGFLGKSRQGLTVRQFVRGVARLGGFLGRKGDGEPGVRTLWRGYQRLQDMLLGIHLLHASPSRDP